MISIMNNIVVSKNDIAVVRLVVVVGNIVVRATAQNILLLQSIPVASWFDRNSI